MVVVCLGFAVMAGCAEQPLTVSSPAEPEGERPLVTVAPSEFVLRDLRKDAAIHLHCQVPNVQVRMGPWAGAAGNVIAYGCGYQVQYYMNCQSSQFCSRTLN
jgi:hypothetical protein